MTVTAIGFANKFYTLWHITEETKPLGNGRSYMITHYTFIKNISFDKETALSKYPEAIFDEKGEKDEKKADFTCSRNDGYVFNIYKLPRFGGKSVCQGGARGAADGASQIRHDCRRQNACPPSVYKRKPRTHRGLGRHAPQRQSMVHVGGAFKRRKAL